jgi:hypothetical protein
MNINSFSLQKKIFIVPQLLHNYKVRSMSMIPLMHKSKVSKFIWMEAGTCHREAGIGTDSGSAMEHWIHFQALLYNKLPSHYGWHLPDGSFCTSSSRAYGQGNDFNLGQVPGTK